MQTDEMKHTAEDLTICDHDELGLQTEGKEEGGP